MDPTHLNDGTNVKVTHSGCIKLKHIKEDSELFLFRIPKGLIDAKDLINQEIEWKKNSVKVKVNGQNLDFVLRNLDNSEQIFPWLPNTKGVLKPSTIPITTEVRVKLHVSKKTKATTDGLDYFEPVVHRPPDLPRRDFFSPSFTIQEHQCPSKKKERNLLENSSPKGRTDIALLTDNKKTRKRKTQNEGHTNFQNSFNDIYPEKIAVEQIPGKSLRRNNDSAENELITVSTINGFSKDCSFLNVDKPLKKKRKTSI